MQFFKTSFRVKAPVADVFEAFSDHEQFGTLFGAKSRLFKSGVDTVNGVGSTRRLGFWPIDFDETVVAYKINELIDYRVSRGSPLKNHLGQVRFSEVAEGTQVDYEVQFESKVPLMGGILEYGFKKAWALNSTKVFSRIEEMA